MSSTSHPAAPGRSRPLTRQRLAQLLEAYGAAPERWPVAQRASARRHLEQSGAARMLWTEAGDLDRLLDAVPSEPPSSALVARVLAAAPRRRPAPLWRRALVAGVPLAAAAAVLVWLGADHLLLPRAGGALVPVGEYTSPTDVLLEPYAVDVSAIVPSVGCADSVLDCPDVQAAGTPYSQRPQRRYQA